MDPSELSRDGLLEHLGQLAAEQDAATWESAPLTPKESSLGSIADWGPDDDWSDWADPTMGPPA